MTNLPDALDAGDECEFTILDLHFTIFANCSMLSSEMTN
jgi:hypothetical protein